MTWFLIDPDGERIELPTCSRDYKASSRLFGSCLHDPDGPICRRHRNFFLTQERKASRLERS